jgi:hypothetical protein
VENVKFLCFFGLAFEVWTRDFWRGGKREQDEHSGERSMKAATCGSDSHHHHLLLLLLLLIVPGFGDSFSPPLAYVLGGFVPYCNWNASLSSLSPYYKAFGFLLSRYVRTPVDHIIAMAPLCVCFRSCSLAVSVSVCVSFSMCYAVAVRTPILCFQAQDFRKATLHNSLVCIKVLLLLSMWFFWLM